MIGVQEAVRYPILATVSPRLISATIASVSRLASQDCLISSHQVVMVRVGTAGAAEQLDSFGLLDANSAHILHGASTRALSMWIGPQIRAGSRLDKTGPKSLVSASVRIQGRPSRDWAGPLLEEGPIPLWMNSEGNKAGKG